MANIHDLGFPFPSVAGDRQYSASEWREYFDALVTSGVVGEIENEMQVKPQAVPNKTVYVDTGAILIKGAMRSLASVVNLTLADNTSGNPRIDRIVARINYTDRKIEFVVKQGAPGASPEAPALVRNTTYWELSLAQIALANGYSTITASEITDERADTTVCGYYRYRSKSAYVAIPGDNYIQPWRTGATNTTELTQFNYLTEYRSVARTTFDLIPENSIVRARFGIKNNDATKKTYGRIYKNGVAVGTEREVTGTSFVYFTEDFEVGPGDYLELFIKTNTSGSAYRAYGTDVTIGLGNIVPLIVSRIRYEHSA